MADTTGGLNLSTGLGSIYDLIRGLSGGDKKDASTAANMADPLNKYRGQAGDMLMNLLTNPGSFSLDPGQQFAVKEGQQAISTAANTQTGSSDPTRTGSLGPALAKYTEGYANEAFDTRIKELFGIASGDPAAAAKAYQTGTTNQQTSLAGGITGIGQILQALGLPASLIKMFTGGGGGGGTGNPLDGSGNLPDTGIGAVPPDPNSPFTDNPPDFSAPLPDITPQIPDWTSGFDLGL